MAHRALIVDDDATTQPILRAAVEEGGFDVVLVTTLAQARARLSNETYELLIADTHLPDGDGRSLLDQVSEMETIMVASSRSVDHAVDAMQRGAADFIPKPVEGDRLRSAIAGAKRRAGLRSEITSLRNNLIELGSFGPLVGRSPSMRTVYELISRVAPTPAAVMIVGETGTGKEVVAQAIHRLSRRNESPFLAVNCGAVPENLIESELFGHDKGAFTGATSSREGVFERVGEGTLFLDEITEMPIELQPKLLRVLETGEFSRVGGNEIRESRARIVSATNRAPAEAVAEDQLREDLFYRLNVFPILLPPLRERDGDVELLALHFLSQLNRESQSQKRFTTPALRTLEDYDWPGNVRQLINVVQRSFILAKDEIDTVALPGHENALPTPSMNSMASPTPTADGSSDSNTIRVAVGTTIAEMEKKLILATLETANGNKRQAAKQLGISVKTLYTRLNRYSAET